MRDRDRDPGDRGRPLDRVRDAAEIRRRAELSRQKERDHPRWGHAFREHVDATDKELERRAATGINARGRQEDFIPEHATRWQSDAACIVAADRAWHTPQARQARRDIEARLRAGQQARQGFEARVSLRDALGPDWRNDVYGRSQASGGLQHSQWRADSQVVAVFRRQADGRWYLYTCYPEVKPRGGP